MPNDRLFRIAGWCALASALALVAFLVANPLGLGTVGGILEIVWVLTLAFVFYALYVVHGPESKGLSLAGLVSLLPVIAVEVVSKAIDGPMVLISLFILLLSLPFLIFGSLAYRSAKMPRGLAVVALVTGATYVVYAAVGVLGSEDLANNVSLIPLVLTFVWLVWLWRVFLSGRLTAE